MSNSVRNMSSTINPFKKGDRVRVQAGAQLYSTNPKYSRSGGGKLAKRSYVVVLQAAYDGWFEYSSNADRPAEVKWAGEGGYWFWTDAVNVEAINNVD